MKVLVTGGAGFIGSHVMRVLLGHGFEAEALDNLRSGRRENLPDSAILIKADVLGKDFPKIVRDGQYDAIVHLAAQTMVNASMDDPAHDAEQNIVGIIRTLEAARFSGARRVIFASSAAVYGDVPEAELPIREDRPAAPMSFYGLSKFTAEKYLSLYGEMHPVDYVILRFANVYGERQGGGGEGGVISIFCEKIAAEGEVTIFGDGNQTRDFIYAGDVARAVAAALETENANRIYNICSETQTSLNELVALLEKISEREITPIYSAERPGDIYKSVLSNARAKKSLGWRPEISLAEGLKRTYEYFLKIQGAM